jgi:hypothetical protein
MPGQIRIAKVMSQFSSVSATNTMSRATHAMVRTICIWLSPLACGEA